MMVEVVKEAQSFECLTAILRVRGLSLQRKGQTFSVRIDTRHEALSGGRSSLTDEASTVLPPMLARWITMVE